MRSIKSKNTAPEMAVRRLLHSLGYRFRLHRRDLPGKPDIVLPRHKSTIFVHGCFWHQHPSPACRNAQTPRTNTDYWVPKLEKNTERDRVAIEALLAQGWKVLVIWECEIGETEALKRTLRRFLAEPYR